jgi:hypothetical protein
MCFGSAGRWQGTRRAGSAVAYFRLLDQQVKQGASQLRHQATRLVAQELRLQSLASRRCGVAVLERVHDQLDVAQQVTSLQRSQLRLVATL